MKVRTQRGSKPPAPPADTPSDGEARPLGRRYLLYERIGAGAMGQVFRARTREGGDDLAVKILRSDLADDADVVARFVQERTVLTRIVNPHVVRVVDMVVEGETLAIVMEHVGGRSLRRVLEDDGPLFPAEAARLVEQILTGIGAAHEQGVVHRDVKPENVLLDEQHSPGVAKVVDFGIGGLLAGSTVTKLTTAVGTPAYMAPEVIGDAPVGAPVDVYASGIVLYELVAGRTPFGGGAGSHPLVVMRRHAEEAPVRPDGVPSALWEVIETLLAKDPQARPLARAAARSLHGLVPKLQDRPRRRAMTKLAQRDTLVPGGKEGNSGKQVGSASSGEVAGPEGPAGTGDAAATELIEAPLVKTEELPPRDVDGADGPRPRRKGAETSGGLEAAQESPSLTIHSAGILPRQSAPRSESTDEPRPHAMWRRVGVAVAVALLVAGAGLGGFLALGGGSPPAAAPAFPLSVYPDGIALARSWHLAVGKRSSRLWEDLTATNISAVAVTATLLEAVPGQITTSTRALHLASSDLAVKVADPVLSLSVRNLRPGSAERASFWIALAKAPSKTTLAAWAGDEQLAEESVLGGLQPSSWPVLVHRLGFSSGSLSLHPGGFTQLALLTGWSGPSQLPVSLQRYVSWTSSSPSVASVRSGWVLARKPGTALVSARLGPDVATSKVIVRPVPPRASQRGRRSGRGGSSSSSGTTGSPGSTAFTLPPQVGISSAGGGLGSQAPSSSNQTGTQGGHSSTQQNGSGRGPSWPPTSSNQGTSPPPTSPPSTSPPPTSPPPTSPPPTSPPTTSAPVPAPVVTGTSPGALECDTTDQLTIQGRSFSTGDAVSIGFTSSRGNHTAYYSYGSAYPWGFQVSSSGTAITLTVEGSVIGNSTSAVVTVSGGGHSSQVTIPVNCSS